MAIPESQLEDWSHQGSITQSKATYGTVKRSLEAPDTHYAGGNSFEVFLQGSYGNDTNIYAESDVDVVIRLDSVYYYDVSGHFKPASNDRNDPATINRVSRHFSSKQARFNSLVSGLFERKMPLLS
jgi:hypothetical protein